MQLIPVILCGGSGSRIWPVSRELRPKPFIRLPDGYSLLQKSALRGAALPEVQKIVTVTNSELFPQVKEEFNEINLTNQTSFILEPFARDTAAAVASAALHIALYHGEEALMLVLATDHLMINQSAFQQSVAAATKLALSGKLITFGMRSHEPNTRYGHSAEDGNILQWVQKFPLQINKEHFGLHRFLWNSSLFLFQAGALLQAMKEHCPDILSTTLTCINQSELIEEDNALKLNLDPTTFVHIPECTLDEAVIRKSDKTAVIPCDLSWIDMGTWNTLGNLIEADLDGNRTVGQTCLHDVSNCHIQGGSRIIGAVGVENLVIIDTPDALLVANKYCVHDVKHIYTQLKQQNHKTHKFHQTVHHTWGSFTLLEDKDQFKIRRIEVKKGQSLNLEMTPHSTHWLVVRGMAKVTNEAKTVVLNTNESTYLSAEQPYHLENTGFADLIIIEIQNGDDLDEEEYAAL